MQLVLEVPLHHFAIAASSEHIAVRIVVVVFGRSPDRGGGQSIILHTWFEQACLVVCVTAGPAGTHRVAAMDYLLKVSTAS